MAPSFRTSRRQLAQREGGHRHEHVVLLNGSNAAVIPEVESAVQRVSTDQRRTYSSPMVVTPSSPLKRLRLAVSAPSDTPATTSEAPNFASNLYSMDRGDDEPGEQTEAEQTERILRPADPVLHQWMLNRRDTYLKILLWREGRGYWPDFCAKCEVADPVYRCEDCFGGGLLCKACCLDVHRLHPLHIVQEWTGVYFSRISLKTLGPRVQLGHPPSQSCARPIAAHDSFILIHISGIHELSVDFCGCHKAEDPYYVQLLRAGWYPATSESPRTCASFSALDSFHTLTLAGKITPYDFYQALEHLSNGAGLDSTPNRYQVFLRIARQYRHLLLLKRRGRGHAQGGVAATAPGELALRCPACPRPGVNLPDGWEKSLSCIYICFLAIDACFRLKRRAISNEIRDPGLGTGWAYMVEWAPYREYLSTMKDQREMSSCSGLAALDHANSKFSRGYSATGVGMGVCARHEFVQPNGVADLQAGERFANMDWIFASIARHLHRALRLMVSYDIACQWAKNLRGRLEKLPTMLRLSLILALIRFVVPKLHIHGHTLICQLLYSLNWVPGSGQTDGEGIERPWSMIGGVAASTRVSGPGARADILDDHWSYWNWKKLLGLPKLLRRRLDSAVHELARQQDAFSLFSSQQAERVSEWKSLVEEFEADGSKPNPYQATVKGATEAQVREELDRQDEEQQATGIRRIHDISPSAFIVELLDIEQEQRRVSAYAELKKTNVTTLSFNLRNARRTLNKRIDRLRVLQATYMPASLQLLAALNLAQSTIAEKVPLFPPSALMPSQRENGGCIPGLIDMERLLRDAQCRSALVSLRNQLHIKYRLLLYKRTQSRHQKTNTRSRTLVTRNEYKILLHSWKYQAAWASLVAIAGGNAVDVLWPQLLKDDIRCLEDSDELARRAAREQKAHQRQVERDEALRKAGLTPLLARRQDPASDDGSEEEEPATLLDTFGSRTGGSYDGSAIQHGESRRTVSWIWSTAGRAEAGDELDEALRIEWAKAWARVRRWSEEVEILTEEWRRFGVSLAYEQQRWKKRAEEVQISAMSVSDAEGAIAYAIKQADIYENLALRVRVTSDDLLLDEGDGMIEDDDGGDEDGNFDEEEDHLLGGNQL
ncbi:CxC2 domain-containing protein [Mycena indigotica]|uniref:CxC2 domain-containing protein n=1 Tax=Mycena indigotica TaxID=2126181 RepID=A0A8H6SCA7_9AGAR|nr:CxC2 domain-containing protein [Mycena indigotica]KAF7296779.1 CxC2 domain-containing protein [Mycena indigotica]